MSRVENSAVEPTLPVAPQKRRIVLIAAVLGGLVALFLAFFLRIPGKNEREGKDLFLAR